MKINIFKSTVIFFLVAAVLLILMVFFELAHYDSSYLNRKSLTFSVNNIDSRKTKIFFRYYDNLYREIITKISKNHKEYWEPEKKSSRVGLPAIKIISKKEDNFLPGRKIEEVEKNFSNWPRSHGGFSSMRFSSLDLINTNNIKKLKLAWIFNSKDGSKGIEANPVVYDGLVYVPTAGNHIVCLNGTNGEEIWRYKVERGYHAAKRGLLIWEDKKKIF